MSNSQIAIRGFSEPMFGENAYVISAARPIGPVAWVIDPGLGRQPQQILDYISLENLTVEKILLTHGHADHIAGVDAIRQAHPNADLLISAADAPMLTDAHANLSAPFGLNVTVQTPASGDLPAGATFDLGGTSWQILDTSGHSPGGRSFYCPVAGVVFTGDALFAGSIGRTDFPGADYARLIQNILNSLLTLPPETVVHSGHGPATTVGNEQKFNPYLTE